jgi:hypothetical protein
MVRCSRQSDAEAIQIARHATHASTLSAVSCQIIVQTVDVGAKETDDD